MTLAYISLPTVVLIFFGLMPSIVALVIDRTEGRYATFCVLGMNFSGLFPFLTDVWFQVHTTDMAIRTMTNVFNLLIIYGSAGFGWVLYMALPPVITTFLSAMSQRRVAELREKQAQIIEEWGESVTTILDSEEGEDPSVPEAAAMPELPDAPAAPPPPPQPAPPTMPEPGPSE
ncbi:MAG TPA: acyl-CoA synthetase [Rhodospirillales bacterium]|nr:acyl-CoA synthetase [Rhodospirillales bacterium]